jgi:hypothetical protein
MLKKDSPMNLAAALSVVQPEKPKTETADIHVLNVKCSLQYVLLAAKKPQYLSNLLVINPYIVANATSHVPEATGKNVKTSIRPSLA